jgi:hypothetical protein
MHGPSIRVRIGAALVSMLSLAPGRYGRLEPVYTGPRNPWRVGCRFSRNKPYRASRRHSGVCAIRRAARKAPR